MTDLITRLRDDYACGLQSRLCEEAADEIDRLRGALRALLEDTQHAAHNCADDRCPVKLARDALGCK